MNSSWKTKSGELVCKWSDVVGQLTDFPAWMREAEKCGSYLEPVPDFASHSPFGGPSWFDPQYRAPKP